MKQVESLEKTICLLKAVVNPSTYEAFVARVATNRPLTRDEGESDHFCCMVIPYYRPSNSVFIGHHVKSDLWIAPGGHIDKGETAQQTILRETQEELRMEAPSQLVPFSLTLVDIENKKQTHCRRHYDIWYLMDCEQKYDFDYDQREFHEAGWLRLEQALRKSSRSAYEGVLLQLQETGG